LRCSAHLPTLHSLTLLFYIFAIDAKDYTVVFAFYASRKIGFFVVYLLIRRFVNSLLLGLLIT
jgi:hypothetical protein